MFVRLSAFIHMRFVHLLRRFGIHSARSCELLLQQTKQTEVANLFTKTVSSLVELISSKGQVLSVETYNNGTLYQVKVHLPATDMSKWTTIPRLKCRVGELDYRDYSPAQWDVTQRTCILYIEAAHEGAGSKWVRQLRPNDTFSYGAAHAQQVPSTPGKILCIGDGSALGHFLALKQLTEPKQFDLDAAVFLSEEIALNPNLLHANPEFNFLHKPENESWAAVTNWLRDKQLGAYSYIYLNGSIPLVQTFRKSLKSIPGMNAKLFAQGFWK
jgi:NADPH-dependent ferric siderophore reductase